VLVLIPLSYVLWHVQIARSVPAIHDITTDVDDPPEIRALAGVPERSLTYDRDNVPQQRAAYADIETIATDQPADVVFRRALEVAAELGWDVVDSDPPRRFQAVDTTLWFGFEDDVVVRVRPFGIGSVIDLRSASRVGRSDIGANAARIRAFRDALDPGFDPGSQYGWEIGTINDFDPAPPEAGREVRDEFVPPEHPAQ
jgi:uncharacterized protein (DUF1499 family)